jgi:hypothetical protein
MKPSRTPVKDAISNFITTLEKAGYEVEEMQIVLPLPILNAVMQETGVLGTGINYGGVALLGVK